MRAVDVIASKRDGGALSREEIAAFVRGVTDGSWPDYQISALLMAIVLRGMTADETTWLTEAMVESGGRVDLSGLPGPFVDKHSTGGVGDKTSLVLAPLVAACGGMVPMMSGRALGHTGGTLDKLEAIPGLTTAIDPDGFRRQLESIGCVIAGQTETIAPADRRMYALRDVTGTVPSIPLIVASILSKKIAEGIDGLVLDVKVGRGAFMKTEEQAGELARALVGTGKRAGLRTEALITSMEAPLGRAVGNALEVAEAIEILKGRGPRELRALCIELAARMIAIARLDPDVERARTRAIEALGSGRALEKFRRMIVAQGGDPRVVDDGGLLPAAPQTARVPAPRDGVVTGLHAELVGRATVALGAGRTRVDETVDHAVGVMVLAAPGTPVAAGDPVLELHYRAEKNLPEALQFAARAIEVSDVPVPARPLILGEVT
jgi:pyrimidine-nucleoside phosphorylase